MKNAIFEIWSQRLWMSHACRALKCLYSSNHRGRRQAPFLLECLVPGHDESGEKNSRATRKNASVSPRAGYHARETRVSLGLHRWTRVLVSDNLLCSARTVISSPRVMLFRGNEGWCDGHLNEFHSKINFYKLYVANCWLTFSENEIWDSRWSFSQDRKGNQVVHPQNGCSSVLPYSRSNHLSVTCEQGAQVLSWMEHVSLDPPRRLVRATGLQKMHFLRSFDCFGQFRRNWIVDPMNYGHFERDSAVGQQPAVIRSGFGVVTRESTKFANLYVTRCAEDAGSCHPPPPFGGK